MPIALPFLAALALGSQTAAPTAQRGDLISYRAMKDYSAFYMRLVLDYIKVPTRAKVSVKLYNVQYSTVGLDGQPYLATGAVAVPRVPVQSSLLSYQHGTVTKRTNVPGSANDEALVVSAIYAASGNYVVSMPDYLGLGGGKGFHPYLHAETEASASLDCMRAARKLCAALKIPKMRDEVYLAGYSQGGHSTLALAKTIQEQNSDEFKIAAVAGMSGPYAPAEVELPFALSKPSLETPTFMAYLALGYQTAYGNVYDNLGAAFQPPYDATVRNLFLSGEVEIQQIAPQLPRNPFDLFTKPIVGPLLLPPYSAFYDDLVKNGLWNWKPEMPMRLYAAESDEIVAFGNSVKASEAMKAKGADIPLVDLGTGLTHVTAFFKALPASRVWFDQVGGYPVKR